MSKRKPTDGRLRVWPRDDDGTGAGPLLTNEQGNIAVAKLILRADGLKEDCGLAMANAERLVACWNACESVDTANLRPGDLHGLITTLDVIRGHCSRLLAACEAFLSSVRQGTIAISEQGVRSPAFQSRADETAAAIRDMKAAVTLAKGDADAR